MRQIVEIRPTVEVLPLEERDLLIEMIRALVSNPDQVKIESQEPDDLSVVFRIHCAKEDIGMVLGKRGVTIDCIRGYFRKVCGRYGKDIVTIEVAE